MAILGFVDTETTGLYESENGLIQVGFILEIDGVVVETLDLKMSLFPEDKIEPMALETNGFTEEQIASFEDPREVYKKFIAVLSKYVNKYDPNDKISWVGQNLNFDMGFLTAWAKKCDDKYFGSFVDWSQRFCTMNVATALKHCGKIPNGENLKAVNLKALCDFFGVKNAKEHDAIGDIMATKEIYVKLKELM